MLSANGEQINLGEEVIVVSGPYASYVAEVVGFESAWLGWPPLVEVYLLADDRNVRVNPGEILVP